jgi:hypothetical protein
MLGGLISFNLNPMSIFSYPMELGFQAGFINPRCVAGRVVGWPPYSVPSSRGPVVPCSRATLCYRYDMVGAAVAIVRLCTASARPRPSHCPQAHPTAGTALTTSSLKCGGCATCAHACRWSCSLSASCRGQPSVRASSRLAPAGL